MTTSEIAIAQQGNEIEVLPPARPAASEAIGQLMMHAQSMAAAKELADHLCNSELVPATYRGKPANGAAAILYGAELGLNPIQSLQQIFVVHGAPAIYARTAVALVVKKAGIIVQTMSSTDASVTVRATDTRTGQVEESTWDIPRATKAGYTSNKKYQTDPQAMLYAKAAMECCRKIAPDVLLGIPYSREELDLEAQPTRVRSERGGVGVGSLRQRAQSAQQAVEAPPAVQAPAAQESMTKAARAKWERSMFAALNEAGCADEAAQLVVITALAGRAHEDAPEHRNGITDDELRLIVGTLGDWKKSGDLAAKVGALMPAAPVVAAVQMATADQLGQLASIRAQERYDTDEEWFGYMADVAGVTATSEEDITSDEAARVIALFQVAD